MLSAKKRTYSETKADIVTKYARAVELGDKGKTPLCQTEAQGRGFTGNYVFLQ
jgi:hypothetical protein